MAHEGYHEPFEKLSEPTRMMHRALESLMEELEAIDWYYQRAEVTDDEALKAILLHNAHEEIEHAFMTLEWIRRHDKSFDLNMRTYLFREGDIVAGEKTAKAEVAQSVAPVAVVTTVRRSLGSLRNDRSDA